MGNQEENVLLRFEGEDANASSTIEKLVALMQEAVVSVDELVAAGYKMSDINEALDVISGGAASASESIGELGVMTKEAALALGQANDILNTGAEAVDTFARDSLSGAEALGVLKEQAGQLSKELDVAWFEVERGVEMIDAMSQATVGADAVFSNFDNRIGLYDEMMAQANDRTNAFTMAITGAQESGLELAQAMYDAADAVGADAEVVYALAEALGVLADAEGQAFQAAQPLVQMTLDFAAAAAEAEAAAAAEAEAAQQLAASFKGTEDELATLTAMFSGTSFDMPGLMAAGYEIEKVQAALQTLIETGDATAAAMTLIGESASTMAGGLDASALALQQRAQNVSDLINMWDNMGAAAEAAQGGIIPLDKAVGEATTTYNELDDASAVAAYDVQALGNEAETTGEKVSGANEGFGMSEYLLYQLGFMAFSAAQQFYNLGVTAQDTLTIIQGKTGASDAEMQQWTQTLEDMGLKGGYTLNEMAQGFDIVTQAQYRGQDGINVLQSAMELARASGSKLTDSTNLLSMSMYAFGASSSEAKTYAAILFAAIANGKQNVQQLTSTLSPVIGEAAAAGISFNDLVNAETEFSRSTSSSSEAARGFQGLIRALAGDSQLTTDQLIKLGLAFDTTKFQTLDFAGKLEYLAKYTDGNVEEFTKLVGGTKDVQAAMDTLDISTKQLAKNAETLGLSFDPVKYNAMDAADKLYYLLKVSGYNESQFKKLTDGGVNPLNAALLKLSLNTDDVSKRAKQMGLNFNEAKFKTDDLKQKLWDLWDASGHNIDKFAELIGGTQNVDAAFSTMGKKSDDAGKKQDDLGKKSDDAGKKQDDLGKKFDGTKDKVKQFDKAFGATSTDLKADSDKISSALSNVSTSFTDMLTKIGAPDALNQVAQAINTLGTKTFILGSIFDMLAGPTILFAWVLNNVGTAADAVGKAFTGAWNAGVQFGNTLNGLPKIASQTWDQITQAFSDGYTGVLYWIQTLVNDILSKFSWLRIQLVGASIIPDMIDEITGVFRNAGPAWLSAITVDINSLLNAFSGLAGQMYNSAAHAVDQFVAGLLSRLPNVEAAASNIAAKVASYLHFSVPEMGPLHDADTYGGDFIDLLATGMETNIGRLQQAASTVARSMSINPTLLSASSSSSPFATQQGIAPIVTVLTQILATLQAQRGSTQGTGVPPSVTMNNSFALGGTSNLQQLYNQLNAMAGAQFEAGFRGGF